MKILRLTSPPPVLTVAQPWACAILQGHKRVENRSWATRHRGPLLIHAAKRPRPVDRKAWKRDTGIDFPEFYPDLGCIVGTVDLGACIALDDLHRLIRDDPGDTYDWLATDPFADGPMMWILGNPRRFPEPVPHQGNLGLWRVKSSLADAVLAQCAAAKPPRKARRR